MVFALQDAQQVQITIAARKQDIVGDLDKDAIALAKIICKHNTYKLFTNNLF